MARVAGAHELLVHGSPKIHDVTALAQTLPGAGIEHRPAPRGEHDSVAHGELVDDRRLALPETLLAFALEDIADVDARTALDLGVGVDEREPEDTGELAPDGALAGAHRPDQEDIGAHRHAQKQRGRRVAAAAYSGTGRAERQYTSAPSRRIFGVTKISSSSLLSVRDLLRNSTPRPGMSPRYGTLLVVSRRSVSMMPPSTTVWPSLTSTWVVISRVSMLGTKPPVALGTTAPTLSLLTVRSRMMRSSGVICGVTFSDSTAFLNWVVVAPLESDSW